MKYKNRTYLLVVTALMAAVMAILSPPSIPVGPVPVTLGVFAVFLTGAMLPLPASLISLAVYLLLGMVGLPVFSGFRGGPQVLAGPTGGFLVGYVFIIIAVGLAARSKKLITQIAAGIAGLALCYLVGTWWFTMVTGATFIEGLLVCVVPFVLLDIGKAVVALGLARLINRRLGGVINQPG